MFDADCLARWQRNTFEPFGRFSERTPSRPTRPPCTTILFASHFSSVHPRQKAPSLRSSKRPSRRSSSLSSLYRLCRPRHSAQTTCRRILVRLKLSSVPPARSGLFRKTRKRRASSCCRWPSRKISRLCGICVRQKHSCRKMSGQTRRSWKRSGRLLLACSRAQRPSDHRSRTRSSRQPLQRAGARRRRLGMRMPSLAQCDAELDPHYAR